MSEILSYLNPASENFFVYKLLELLSDLLEFLFVPSEERITALTNTVSSKFSFIDTIKIAINSLVDIINNIGNAPKLTINVEASKFTEAQKLTILDLNWYAPFKSYGDIIITGFAYAIYLWHLFIKLPGIISGTSGGIEVIERKLKD